MRADFEISRGVTTLTEAEARATGAPRGQRRHAVAVGANSQGVSREGAADGRAIFAERGGGSASEALALHLRDSREVLQILISDTVNGSAAQVVKAATPPDRIRIERFGKGSIVLARCGASISRLTSRCFRRRAEFWSSTGRRWR